MPGIHALIIITLHCIITTHGQGCAYNESLATYGGGTELPECPGGCQLSHGQCKGLCDALQDCQSAMYADGGAYTGNCYLFSAFAPQSGYPEWRAFAKADPACTSPHQWDFQVEEAGELAPGRHYAVVWDYAAPQPPSAKEWVDQAWHYCASLFGGRLAWLETETLANAFYSWMEGRTNHFQAIGCKTSTAGVCAMPIGLHRRTTAATNDAEMIDELEWVEAPGEQGVPASQTFPGLGIYSRVRGATAFAAFGSFQQGMFVLQYGNSAWEGGPYSLAADPSPVKDKYQKNGLHFLCETPRPATLMREFIRHPARPNLAPLTLRVRLGKEAPPGQLVLRSVNGTSDMGCMAACGRERECHSADWLAAERTYRLYPSVVALADLVFSDSGTLHYGL